MFIIHALATFCRGALLFLATFAAAFHHCSRFDHFCRPDPYFGLLRLHTFADGRACFCRTFVLNGYNVHFKRFFSGFKRVNCVAYTFAPFVLFCALIESYFRLFCRFRG